MFDYIKGFIKQLFRRSRRSVTVQPIPHEQNDESHNVPSQYIPIETQFEGSEIPGTQEWIGEMAKVIQTVEGEYITWERKKGIQGACGHMIYGIDEKITETELQLGLGGICKYCGNPEKNKIGLVCSRCVSHCDSCGTRSICTTHARPFTNIDGEERLLCPDCRSKAGLERFFKKTLLATLWPLLDHNRPSDSQKRRDDYDY